MGVRRLSVLVVGCLWICVNNVTGQSAVKPKEAVLSTQDRRTLAGYFSVEQMGQIEEYLNDYRQVKTASDLHKSYGSLDKSLRNLSDSLSAKQQRYPDTILSFDAVNAILTGVHFDLYEGGVITVNPELSRYKKLAKATPEKSDDDFVAIKILVYGDKYGPMPRWINQTWDYGGTSLLGDETELNILTKIQAALAASKEFESELNEIREMIVQDITLGRCYEYNGAKITAEIKKIIASVKLNSEEKMQMEERMKEFEHSVKELQVDCKNRECRCGG